MDIEKKLHDLLKNSIDGRDYNNIFTPLLNLIQSETKKAEVKGRIDELMDIPRKAEVRRKDSKATTVKERLAELQESEGEG